MYVVVAVLEAKRGRVHEFLRLMQLYAVHSRAEAGCRRFELHIDSEVPERVLLYEIYDDETAYVSHRAGVHYARFREFAPDMLVSHEGDLFVSRRVLTHLSGPLPTSGRSESDVQ